MRVAEAVLVLVVPQLQRFERLDVGDLVEDLTVVLNDVGAEGLDVLLK